jgi:subtilisin family serine protease
MKTQNWMRTLLLGLLILTPAFAQDRYLVRVHPSRAFEVAARHGISIESQVVAGQSGLYVVRVPAGAAGPVAAYALSVDPQVSMMERDTEVKLPEVSSATLDRTPVVPALRNAGTFENYFGDTVWGAYTNQTAAGIIRVNESRQYATGAGVVATIDTGADFRHPALKSALVSGWDFTRQIQGGDESADLTQETTPILDQETTPILDGTATIILNQETTPILDQETTPILDTRIPPALGHGTMVAGLIHLVAPTAKIMPLKVFTSDGTTTLSQVIAGIYYAVEHGANVINMSFSTPQDSQELKKAMDYAHSRQVICVAAAGNEGQQMSVYPAGNEQVFGIGSTSDVDMRSSFSNYGSVVTLAAPGEAVISTYPGNRYAAAWGTSFSAPLVAGAVALLEQLNPGLQKESAEKAISQARPLQGQGLGAGRLDLVKVLFYASTHGN